MTAMRDADRPHRRPTTGVTFASVFTMFVVLLASCGESSPEESRSGGGRTEIRLITYSSFVLDEGVKQDIEDALDISLVIEGSGDSAEALNRAILNAGNPEGDVFFGVDNTLMTRALSTDVFTPVEGSFPTASAANGLDLGDRLVPIQTGAVCIDYDKEWFAEAGIAPPASMEDLTDPLYEDLLVVENPVASSPGLAFLVATHARFGDESDGFWSDLRDNGVLVAGSWDDAWYTHYSASGGDRPLVVSYASSPPAEVFFSEGTLDTPISGVVEDTCFEQVEFAGVLAGSEHAEEAKRVVEYMTGLRWQEALPLTNFVQPANPDAVSPEIFEKFAVVPEELISMAPDEIDSNRESWIDEWRRIME